MAVVVAAEGGLPQGAESSGNSPSTILDMAKSPNGRKVVLMIGVAAVHCSDDRSGAVGAKT